MQDVSGGHSSELIGHRARECDCSGKVAPELLPVGVGASSDHRPEGTALGVAAHERLRKHLQLHSLPGGLHRPPLDQPDRPDTVEHRGRGLHYRGTNVDVPDHSSVAFLLRERPRARVSPDLDTFGIVNV